MLKSSMLLADNCNNAGFRARQIWPGKGNPSPDSGHIHEADFDPE